MLGVLAKLRGKKKCSSFIMSVCPLTVRLSVRMEQLGAHWTDFCKI